MCDKYVNSTVAYRMHIKHTYVQCTYLCMSNDLFLWWLGKRKNSQTSGGNTLQDNY